MKKHNINNDKPDSAIWDVFDSMMHTLNIKHDNFFPNEIIEKVNTKSNYSITHRVASKDELQVITQNAFDLLLFWIKDEQITVEFFERFMTILTSYQGKIHNPVSEDTIVGMIEMISISDFRDHVIYNTLDLFVHAPQILNQSFSEIL